MPPAPTLLIQTAFIGDVILATALVEQLHAAAPATPLDVLVRRGNESLLAGHPHIRRVLVWDKRRGKYAHLWQLLQDIRAAGYGRVITLQRFASTGFLTAFSGAPQRVGFTQNPFSRFFTHRVKHVIGDGRHEVERNLFLVAGSLFLVPDAALPGEQKDPETPNQQQETRNQQQETSNKKLPRLYPTPADEAAAAPYAAAGPYYCIAPTSVWFTKQYPEGKWLELLAALPPGRPAYLLGGPPDAAACARLAAGAGRANVVSLAGQLGLLASAALMRGAAMNFVNDSAPLHLCSAVGAPVTAVFCSTVPAFGFGPLGPNAFVVETPEALACRPCGLHGHAACPLGHFKCAHGIAVGQLLAGLG